MVEVSNLIRVTKWGRTLCAHNLCGDTFKSFYSVSRKPGVKSCRPLCIAYGGIQAHGAADGEEDRADLLTLMMCVQRPGNFRVDFGFEIGELL